VAELGHKTEDQAKKNNASFDIFITMQVKRKYEALALINMKNIMPAWSYAMKELHGP
jgi:hypothetical protein